MPGTWLLIEIALGCFFPQYSMRHSVHLNYIAYQ